MENGIPKSTRVWGFFILEESLSGNFLFILSF